MKLFILTLAGMIAATGTANAIDTNRAIPKGKGATEIRTETLRERFERAMKEKGTRGHEIDLSQIDSQFREPALKNKVESLLTRISASKNPVQADILIMQLSLAQELVRQQDGKAAVGGTRSAQAKVDLKVFDVVETFTTKAELTVGNESGEKTQLALLEVLVDAKAAVKGGKSLKEGLVDAVAKYREKNGLSKLEDLEKRVEDCFGV